MHKMDKKGGCAERRAEAIDSSTNGNTCFVLQSWHLQWELKNGRFVSQYDCGHSVGNMSE